MARSSGSEARRGLLPAAVLLFVLAALCVARALLPEEWVAVTWDAGAAQFGAFYLTLLGVGLLQESDNARRFVCFAAAPLFLIGATLAVLGHGRERLFGAALAALASGLAGLLLGRRRSPARVAVSLAVAAAASALVFPLEIAVARGPRDEARRTLARWTAAERAWARADLGVELAAPPGWVILRSGSPYVPPDPAVVLVLLHPESDARAILRVEPERQAGTLEEYLDGFAEAWEKRAAGLRVEGRGGATVGGAAARRIDVAWQQDDTGFAGDAVAWRDASRTLVIAAWYETAAGAAAAEALDDLRRSLAVTFPLTARIARAVAAASGEMPQMTRRAIELVATRRPDGDPPTLFRDGLAAVSVGFPRLGPEQEREMLEINRELYGRMPGADAVWMEDYLRRVRAAQPVRADENARGMRAMAAAVSRMPEASRERLRALLERAIAAALEPPPRTAAATSEAAEPLPAEPGSEPFPSEPTVEPEEPDTAEEPGTASEPDPGAGAEGRPL